MASSQKPNVTSEEIHNAKNLWLGFTKLLKYGTIATIITVIILALITL